jgi:hypothetical protein
MQQPVHSAVGPKSSSCEIRVWRRAAVPMFYILQYVVSDYISVYTLYSIIIYSRPVNFEMAPWINRLVNYYCSGSRSW